jgi:hypothetical protein
VPPGDEHRDAPRTRSRTTTRSRIPRKPPLRWFAVAAGSRLERVNGELVPRPQGVVHAKEMGTNLTACGLVTASMHRFWDLPFPVEKPTSCPDCRECTRPGQA